MGTGSDLRENIVRATNTAPLPVPAGFTAKHGQLGGQVVLHANSLPGTASYEAAPTDGDPADPAAWKDAGTFAGCNRIELEGLTPPGKTHRFRLRGIDSNGAWTNPAGLMVI